MNDKCCYFLKTTIPRASAIFYFLQDARFLKRNLESQNKLASLGSRSLQSPKRLLVYPIAKEQFRSTSLTRGMLEKKGNAYVS